MENIGSHIVLARKYRPQKFLELIGQEVLSTTIQNAIKMDRVAHAFLLTGIRGVGKTTTARIIAKALNCTGRKEGEAEPCGECDNCKAISSDRHIDVVEIDAASHTGVDNVREEIIENAKYAPSNGKYKVYIIDEVHMLSKQAFNALLKTLEEPPAHTKFILATTEIQKVPVTILSRCQRFELKRIKHDELISFLKAICKQEEIDCNDEALALIAKAAEGSVRDSLSILDQAASFNEKKLTTDNIREMLGQANSGVIYKLLAALLEGNSAEALSIYNDIVSGTTEPESIINQLLEACHTVSLVKIGTSNKGFNIERNFDEAQSLSDKAPLSTLTIFHQAFLKGLQELGLASDAFSCAEMLLIRVAHLANLPRPEELLEEVKKKPSAPEPQPKSIVETAVGTPTTSAEPEILQLPDFPSVVELFKSKGELMVYSFLKNNARLVAFENNKENGKIEVNIDDTVPQNILPDSAKFLRSWTGKAWTVIKSSQEGENSIEEQQEQSLQKDIEAVENSQLAQNIKEAFPEAKLINLSN